MFQIIYSGQFVSQKGVTWKCDILRDQDAAPEEVGDLTFPAEEPLVISWEEKDKDEPICSSTATLQIESPGDRTYVDLYSIKSASVRLDVYREGTLYWSGTLDPEFYEEPYEQLNHYDVSLTFSDFGLLGRLKFSLTGTVTLEGIVRYILGETKINYHGIDYNTYSSTYLSDGTTRATLDKLSLPAANFYDEDNEPTKLEDVLKDILQPLALRIIQRAGKIWIYDLNGLYQNGTRKEITWDGDSQMLGTDKVYNNVKITFSPYADSDILDTEIKYIDAARAEQTNMDHSARKIQNKKTGHEYYSFYPDYSDSNVKDDTDNISFTLHLTSKGYGVKGVMDGLKYYKIVSQLGGSESEGLCVSAVLGHCWSAANATGKGIRIGMSPTERDGTEALFTSQRVFLPALAEADAARCYLRLKVEALLDPRYNPFSQSGAHNDKDAYDAMEEDFSYVFIPACVTLYDKDGNAIAYYDNYDAATNSHNEVHFLPTLGSWKSGGETTGRCWLEYYDKESNRRHKTGILGYHTNRQTIGASREDLTQSFQSMEDGQYIPYPAQGGYLEIKICKGIWAYWDLGWTVTTTTNNGSSIIEKLSGQKTTYVPLPLGESYEDSVNRDKDHIKWLDRIRWYLIKAPEVDIVGAYAGNEKLKSNDIEYTGYVNRDAKEELAIDTTVGTAEKVLPTARGILLDARTGLQIQKMTRNGVTDHPERLLIGTVCSQYADRHVTLTGEAESPENGLEVYTEQNQGERVFLLTQEEQDVITDCSDLKITELSPDSYEGIEEVEEDSENG